MEKEKEIKIEEYFNNELIKELSDISNNFDYIDNNERADAMIELLNDYGFKEIGCGTNRIVVKDDIKNSKIVFKIALDTRGNADNNSEERLSKEIPQLTGVEVAKTYDNNELILISEYCPVMCSDDMKEFKAEVYEQLEQIKRFYLLNDVGPKSFMNWGFRTIDDNDIPILIDYAYLANMDTVSRTVCGKCGHELVYSKKFEYLKCSKCGTRYSFAQVANQNSIADEYGINTK